MTVQVLDVDNELSFKLILLAFDNVKNIDELRQKIVKGSLECSILKRNLIVDPLQIQVAANKALLAAKYNQLTTKNIYTEILFNLSISKNITQSLMQFGVGEKDTSIIIVIVAEQKSDDQMADIIKQIDGEQIDPFPNDQFDEKKIMKLYKITQNELKVSNVIDSIVSRISTKDFTSF